MWHPALIVSLAFHHPFCNIPQNTQRAVSKCNERVQKIDFATSDVKIRQELMEGGRFVVQHQNVQEFTFTMVNLLWFIFGVWVHFLYLVMQTTRL